MIEPYREGNISMWGRCICAVFMFPILVVVYPFVVLVTFIGHVTGLDRD